MGSVSSLPSGLAALSQSGGVFSAAAIQLSSSALESAAPQDLVSLSSASLALQQVDGIFGIPAPSSSQAAAQVSIAGSQPAADAAANSSTTPAQQAASAAQSMQTDLMEALFAPPVSQAGTLSTFV